MEYCISPTYDRVLLRRAGRRFWARYFGWGTPFLIVVGPIVAAWFIANWTGPSLLGWQAILVGGWVLCLASPLISYFQWQRSAEGFLSFPISFTVSEESLCVETDATLNRCAWKVFPRLLLWQFPDCWMLFIGANTYYPLPTASLDEQTQTFLREQVEAHGGKVRANPRIGFGRMYFQRGP